jgi:RNA polymerase sigma-70 factor (sigma-E family)
MSKTDEFEAFAHSRLPQLYRSAWLLCGDTHLAEDLVQETLAKVYTRWMRRVAAPIENPAAYAQTTLVRTFISQRRRRSSRELPSDALPESMASAGDADLRMAVAAGLAQLPPLDRAVLVLRFLEDLSVTHTATQLGVSEGAVRNRSMRALARLRDHFGASLPDLTTL